MTLPGAALIKPDEETLSYVNPIINYDYDKLGNKISETSANGNMIIKYAYDQLGRQTKVTTYKKDGTTMISETKNHYDAQGNRIQTIDGNNGAWNYRYSVRGRLLEQEDPEHHKTRYRYDPLGNKIAVIDPRNIANAGFDWYTVTLSDGISTVKLEAKQDNKTFTTWYLYDKLNRLYRTVLPDDNPPADPYAASIDGAHPYIAATYDGVGNKLSERDANGLTIAYTYTIRNWVETVKQNGELKYTYDYDSKGNRTDVTDARTHKTHTDYDSLNRVRKVTRPSDLTERNFTYDGIGNRLTTANGRGDTTTYFYNPLGWLIRVRDPLQNYTEYRYDLNGNQVEVIAANGLKTVNYYDELNRLIEQKDPLQKSTSYSYDPVGNRIGMTDRKGSIWSYQYYGNNLLKQLDVINGAEKYNVEYEYDEAGNRETVMDSSNTVNYNFDKVGKYQGDPLNRITSIDRTFDMGNANYRTEYQYNPAKPTLLAGIKYPEAISALQYNYDGQSRVNEVVGFTKPQGISYYPDDTLQKISYANNVVANFNYDDAGRLQDLTVNGLRASIMEQHYTYKSQTNNIETIYDGKGTKTFIYDADNQLTKSITPGKFMESESASGSYGLKVGDYLGAKMIDFTPTLTAMMGLDYNSSSIGIDFGTVAQGIKLIRMIADNPTTNRITGKTLDLYTSANNSTYTLVPRSNWTFEKKQNIITITLTESVAIRYLKVHVKFDERNADFSASNKATFLKNQTDLNIIAKSIQVYQEATSRTEELYYDAAGNRTLQRVTLVNFKSYSSLYYTNSDRLKTDGKYYYNYDDNGNLIEKGNKATFDNAANKYLYTASGEEVEYWLYDYDLLNRLNQVTKNGTIIAKYGYDPEGLRVVKEIYQNGVNTDKIHYVFEGTEPIFEKRISDGRIRSYIYALGKHLARVDGHEEENADGETIQVIDNTYFYHTDHLGSVQAVTDSNGTKVWNADYLPFGQQYTKDKISLSFEEDDVGFTGKELDGDTGLYYYNARWYDTETGRFISEDPVGDPNNPNLYSYCRNNPVTGIDPTGNYGYDAQTGEISFADGTSIDTNGNVTNTPPGGSNAGYAPWGGGGPSSSGGNPQISTSYDKRGNKTDSVTDDKGNKISETQYDNKGNLKGTKYYNIDGTLQSEYTFNKDYTISTYTAYNPDGTRTKVTYNYDKNGILITKQENQKQGLFGWSTGDVSITGYNDQNDLANNDENFAIDKNGKVTSDKDIINGILLSEGCVKYLGTLPLNSRYQDWINLIRSRHYWDFKVTLKNAKFTFNGNIYTPAQFGNINFGYTGSSIGLSKDILDRGAGFYQILSGTSIKEWSNPLGKSPYGDDPADQQMINIGISTYNGGKQR